MIFFGRATLQQQPARPIEDEHRERAMKHTVAMGAHLLDYANFAVVFIHLHEHRTGGHRLVIHLFLREGDQTGEPLILLKRYTTRTSSPGML